MPQFTYVYYKVLVSDLTVDMIDKSLTKNVMACRKTLDNAYVILKYCKMCESVDLLRLGYSSMTYEAALSELTDEAWRQAEVIT